LALGLLDDNQFEGQLETFHCDKEGYLFACSDGLLEATNEDGDTISLEILLSWLKEIQVDKIEFVTDKLSKFLGNQSPHDDVAFLIAPFASAVN
jgi:serine phosphatase RsbU (regulator of sigma subunit)